MYRNCYNFLNHVNKTYITFHYLHVQVFGSKKSRKVKIEEGKNAGRLLIGLFLFKTYYFCDFFVSSFCLQAPSGRLKK